MADFTVKSWDGFLTLHANTNKAKVWVNHNTSHLEPDTFQGGIVVQMAHADEMADQLTEAGMTMDQEDMKEN
jgi:hypothetical protein